jgi:hypothetical protein
MSYGPLQTVRIDQNFIKDCSKDNKKDLSIAFLDQYKTTATLFLLLNKLEG